MKAGYGSSLEHLLCEAKRVDLLLRRQIILLRSAGRQSPWDEFRGLYISEEDMDGLLDSSFPSETISASASAEGGVAAQLTRVIQDLEAEIQRKKERALHAGVELRLEYLKEGFSLSPAETDILLIGLLPELQLKYETMYAYLQDDVTRKAPSVEMVLSLFSESIEDKLAAREAFLPGSRLLRNRLLSLYETHSSNSRCLSGKALGLERRVADYLLGSDEVDADLTSFVRVVQPQAKLTEILLPASAATQLQSLTHDGGCDGASSSKTYEFNLGQELVEVKVTAEAANDLSATLYGPDDVARVRRQGQRELLFTYEVTQDDLIGHGTAWTLKVSNLSDSSAVTVDVVVRLPEE